MEWRKRISNWIKKGSISSLMVAILVLIFEAIFELKVQNSFEKKFEPLILSPLQISLSANILQIVLFFILVILILFATLVFIEDRIKKTMGKKLIVVTDLEPPTKEQGKFSSTDVITEIVNARKKKITPEQLARTIINAVNMDIITPHAAAETLEEFNYTLVLLGDGRYTTGKER